MNKNRNRRKRGRPFYKINVRTLILNIENQCSKISWTLIYFDKSMFKSMFRNIIKSDISPLGNVLRHIQSLLDVSQGWEHNNYWQNFDSTNRSWLPDHNSLQRQILASRHGLRSKQRLQATRRRCKNSLQYKAMDIKHILGERGANLSRETVLRQQQSELLGRLSRSSRNGIESSGMKVRRRVKASELHSILPSVNNVIL